MSPDNFSVTQTQTAPNTQTIISLPVPGTRRLHCTSLTGQRLWGLHRRRPGSPASLRKSQASKLKDRCLHMDVNLKNENYVWILHTQVSNGIYSHYFYILLNYNRAVNINYEKKTYIVNLEVLIQVLNGLPGLQRFILVSIFYSLPVWFWKEITSVKIWVGAMCLYFHPD